MSAESTTEQSAFETTVQEEIYTKVAQWMQEIFGEEIAVKRERASVTLMYGTAYIVVKVYPWGSDEAVIWTRCFVVTGAEITPECMHYLLRKNADMRLGAFGLDEDNDIFFEYSLVGTTADKKELKEAVKAVAQVADKYDEEIRSRWGGERATDR